MCPSLELDMGFPHHLCEVLDGREKLFRQAALMVLTGEV